MADWNQPTLASAYTTLLPALMARDTDAAAWLDSATVTVTNPVSGMKRWNTGNAYFEQYNGTSWAKLCTAYVLDLGVGSTINGAVIGAVTQAAASFTTLNSSGLTKLATASRVLVSGATDDGVNSLQVQGPSRVTSTSTSSAALKVDSSGAAQPTLASIDSGSNTDTSLAFTSVGISRIQNINTTTGNFTGLDFADSGAPVARIASVNLDQTNHYGAMAFITKGSAGSGERMRISSLGRVLLGTTTDDGTNLLQVNGTVKATAVNLASDPATALQAATKQYVDNLLAGALTPQKVTASTGVVSTGDDLAGSGGQFRAVNGNYGVMLRNDGVSAYLLQTASGTPLGAYNSYRPLGWNLSTGAVTIDGTGAGVSFGGAIKFTGTGATPYKYINAGFGTLQIMNSSNTAVIMSIDDAGNLTTAGSLLTAVDGGTF